MNDKEKREKLVMIIKNKGDCTGLHCKLCPLGTLSLNPPLSFCDDFRSQSPHGRFDRIYKAAIEKFIKEFGETDLFAELV